MRPSKQDVLDNHARWLERNAVYRRYGYDVERNVEWVLSHALPLTGRVLEIGTGQGRFLTALLFHVPRVTSMDVDPVAQRHARLNVGYAKPPGRARFVIADAARLPWPAHGFDSVVSMNALHHIQNLPSMVDEALRVVKPGGKLVWADFSEKGFSIAEQIHRAEGRIHERVPYRFEDIMAHLAAKGWTAVLRSDDCQDILIAVRSQGYDDARSETQDERVGIMQKGDR